VTKPSTGELAKQQSRFIPNPLWCAECDGRGYLVADAEWEPHAVQCQVCKDRRSVPAQADADAARKALIALIDAYETQDADNFTDALRNAYENALKALASPPPAQADAKLADLVKEYADDLRRNSPGSDGYPIGVYKSVADYLEILISRAAPARPAQDRSSAERADGASAFDPEAQFDADADRILVREPVPLANHDEIGRCLDLANALASRSSVPGDAVRKALELCIEELEESLENEGRLASFKAAIEKGRAALAFPPLADHAEPSVDFMFQAAERANKRFGKWMPQQWLEIFIDEMVGRS
jgi:hypothetical protein